MLNVVALAVALLTQDLCAKTKAELGKKLWPKERVQASLIEIAKLEASGLSREGIDDLKYLGKLETLIAQARKAGRAGAEAGPQRGISKRSKPPFSRTGLHTLREA